MQTRDFYVCGQDMFYDVYRKRDTYKKDDLRAILLKSSSSKVTDIERGDRAHLKQER